MYRLSGLAHNLADNKSEAQEKNNQAADNKQNINGDNVDEGTRLVSRVAEKRHTLRGGGESGEYCTGSTIFAAFLCASTERTVR
jgi:hypothetical protein